MPRLDTDKYFEDADYRAGIKQLVEWGVGGFCIFKGHSISVRKMTDELQIIASVPLLFSADFENGLCMRLSDGTSFPHAMAFGRMGDTDSTSKAAQKIAKEAKSIGVHWNFAPVADINTNKSNPIINIRSFGEDCETVSSHAAAYIEGTQKEKVLACAKHFPGHGDTVIDSHIGIPVLDFPPERLFEIELRPFEQAVKSGVKSIMIGHLAVPALDDSGLPASLSAKIVTGLLREKLGFDGLILTDALDMKAISEKYATIEASRLALKAGNNVLLLPENPFILGELENEAESDDALKAHIYGSYKKIISLKRWCGLIPQYAKPDDKLPTFSEHSTFALKVALSAIEIKGKVELLPIKESAVIAGLALVQKDEDVRSASRFFTMFAQALENDCDFGFIDENITDDQVNDLRENLKDAGIIILPVFYKSRGYAGSVDVPERMADILKKLSIGKESIIILLGNPYLDDMLEGDLTIKTYSDSFASLAAAVVKLSGREAAVDM